MGKTKRKRKRIQASERLDLFEYKILHEALVLDRKRKVDYARWNNGFKKMVIKQRSILRFHFRNLLHYRFNFRHHSRTFKKICWMDRKQFHADNHTSHKLHGFLDSAKANITEEETTTAMNEIRSSTQILFILLFQIGFRLISEPFDFFTKAFLFILVDVLMVLIVVSEWFNSKVEWQLWVKEIYGE